MATVVALDINRAEGLSLADYLHTPVSKPLYDLSGSSLIHVLHCHEDYCRRYNPKYSHKTVINNIDKLQRKYNITIMPAKVDVTFYLLLFTEWYQNGIKPSSIQTYFNNIRAALSWGRHFNCPVSATFNKVTIPGYSKPKVALTIEEVAHIYYFDVNTIKCRSDLKQTYRKVIDMFVLSCCLMQRYSDMKRITTDNFSENGDIFKITQQKTGNVAKVVISKYAMVPKICREILQRYDYHAPFTGCTQHYNRYLHEIINIIGGNFTSEKIVCEHKINGVLYTEEYTKAELITSHTGRRSGITWNVLRGVAALIIMICSGHKELRQFQKYFVRESED